MPETPDGGWILDDAPRIYRRSDAGEKPKAFDPAKPTRVIWLDENFRAIADQEGASFASVAFRGGVYQIVPASEVPELLSEDHEKLPDRSA